MQTFKALAKDAKQRMKSRFWEESKQRMSDTVSRAVDEGHSRVRAQKIACQIIKREVKKPTTDDFYLKVCHLLDTEGEVSDAIGRLTDRAYYDTLSYAERQRYLLELSDKYVAAVEKYKKEKQLDL